MSRKYFGTDGIRGETNREPMTALSAIRIGMAAGLQFLQKNSSQKVLIGRDTRLSGDMLQSALTAGFTTIGLDVVDLGIIPTPAVAILTKELNANLGVMISASHNPFQDNGIKFFGPDGFKLTENVEEIIEEKINKILTPEYTSPENIGSTSQLLDASEIYIQFLKKTIPTNQHFTGIKIVIDCANGGAYQIAPKLLSDLGATIIPIGVNPDGLNINKNCGSTSPTLMIEEVLKNNANLGIAFDGDADRLIMADENGSIIDGDQLLTIIAEFWLAQGKLKGNGIVATVMTNLAAEHYLNSKEISLLRTNVGDRYVVEKMKLDGFNVGGEQSGHIVLLDYCPTGDALIALLQLLLIFIEENKPISQITNPFKHYPQKLTNIVYNGESPINKSYVKKAIKEAEALLKNKGRLLVRNSGTEPLLRIMVEANEESLVSSITDHIVKAIKVDPKKE